MSNVEILIFLLSDVLINGKFFIVRLCYVIKFLSVISINKGILIKKVLVSWQYFQIFDFLGPFRVEKS